MGILEAGVKGQLSKEGMSSPKWLSGTHSSPLPHTQGAAKQGGDAGELRPHAPTVRAGVRTSGI